MAFMEFESKGNLINPIQLVVYFWIFWEKGRGKDTLYQRRLTPGADLCGCWPTEQHKSVFKSELEPVNRLAKKSGFSLNKPILIILVKKLGTSWANLYKEHSCWFAKPPKIYTHVEIYKDSEVIQSAWFWTPKEGKKFSHMVVWS